MYYRCMHPGYRQTMYRRCTTAQYAALLVQTATLVDVDFGHQENDARAHVLAYFNKAYWPPEGTVRSWLILNWEEWSDECFRPKWFTPAWLQLMPDSVMTEGRA